MMPYFWEPPFVFITALFMTVMSGLGLYRWRKWRKEQRQDAMAEASFDALMREIRSQRQTDEAAHRLLALADTLPPMPTLPVLIPAASLDASDTTPMPEQTNTYCLACWLEWIGKPQRDYFAPEGIAAFCERHAYMTLARALSAQQQQRETGDKYL